MKYCKTLFLLALLAASTTARATLIGDEINLEWQMDGPFQSTVRTVNAGTADSWVFGVPSSNSTFNVNPESNYVEFFWAGPGGMSFQGDHQFNGFIISGISHTLIGVSVEAPFADWDDSRVSFTASSFSVNFVDLIFWGEGVTNPRVNDNLRVNLTFEGASVPDSGSSAGLIGASLLGLAAIACRRRTA